MPSWPMFETADRLIRKATVRVQWPDGRPSAGTNVSAWANGYIGELGKTDERGQLEMALLEAVTYRFEARAWTSYRVFNGNKFGDDWVDAEEQKITAGPQSTSVTLVLSRPKLKR
jgi:hypothetical protein